MSLLKNKIKISFNKNNNKKNRINPKLLKDSVMGTEAINL